MKIEHVTGNNSQLKLPKPTLVTCPEPLDVSLFGVQLSVYPTEEAVNHRVADALINVFRASTPHVVALAADSTHGNDPHANGGEGRFGGIYSRVDTFFRANPEALSGHVRATNLDEIDPSSVVDSTRPMSGGKPTESFAQNIKNDLGYVLDRLEKEKRWLPLDPKQPHRYIHDLLAPSGVFWERPYRIGFFGLGAGADGAHLAYFGERKNIFHATSRIELGKAEAQRRNATHAFSLGSDALEAFDRIVITVKEDRKAASLLSGFRDTGSNPQTGLGWAIQHMPHRLHIIADRAAAEKLFADRELTKQMRRSEELSPKGGGGRPSNGPAHPTESILGWPLPVEVAVPPSKIMDATAERLRRFRVAERASKKSKNSRMRFA